MALLYQRGTILCISQVLDPNKANPKDRYVVLLVDLDSEDPLLFGAAITGSFTFPLPATSIRLPFRKGGNTCRTGLTKDCIADCTWIVQATPADILGRIGFTPAKELLAVMQQVSAYLAAAIGAAQNPQAVAPTERKGIRCLYDQPE